MGKELRLPIALWVLTSAALVLWSLSVESAVIVAGIYVGLNGASLFVTMMRDPPFPVAAMKAMAWCTAAQLPVMLVLLLDPKGTRSEVDAAMQEPVEAERPKPDRRLSSRRMRPAQRPEREMPPEVEPDPG